MQHSELAEQQVNRPRGAGRSGTASTPLEGRVPPPAEQYSSWLALTGATVIDSVPGIC